MDIDKTTSVFKNYMHVKQYEFFFLFVACEFW